jgi:protein involved in polysaccharide export with SLBB domain
MRILGLAAALLLLLGVGGASYAQVTMSILNPPQQSSGSTPTTAGATSTTGTTTGQTSSVGATGQSAAGVPGAPSATNPGTAGSIVRPSTGSASVGTGTTAAPLTGVTAGIPAVASSAGSILNPNPGGFITTTDGLLVPVFGTNMFTGSFAGTRPGDRPDYIIQPGDSVVINLFGAVNSGGVQVVDATGNVFVSGVGPVRIGGQRASDLQATVSGAVARVFTSAVGVYATVNQAGTIGVYVSGNVARPGRYLGGARDSVLFFISQAGGVDPGRGSMRNIEVRRAGKLIANYDLYDFLLTGSVAPLHFEDGDVVVVAPRGPMIGVTGAARNAFAFEAPAGAKSMTGGDLLALAKAEPTVTGAALHGYRNDEPRSAYFTLPDFARVVLSDADHVEFRSDSFNGSVTVSIQGEVKGPSVYVMPRGSTVSQLMAQIPLQGTDVEPRWVHVQRPEVAVQQKLAINSELFNLQKQVLTSAPATNTAAQLATAQATLINQFVTQAQTVQPDGNIALYHNGVFQDLRLQDGDTVILPNRTDVVIVTGEVLSPGGLTHVEGMDIEHYVDLAGGYAEHANRKRYVLRHRDGSAAVATPKDKPLPGDELVVLPKIGDERLQLFIDLSQLFFQLALTSATVAKL